MKENLFFFKVPVLHGFRWKKVEQGYILPYSDRTVHK